MKRLSVLLLACGVASIAQGMDPDARWMEGMSILGSIQGLTENAKAHKLWGMLTLEELKVATEEDWARKKLAYEELADMLAYEVKEKGKRTRDPMYEALVEGLKSRDEEGKPLYNGDEKVGRLSNALNSGELLTALIRGLLVKIYRNDIENLLKFEDEAKRFGLIKDLVI